MLDLMIAAVLQQQPVDPCYTAGIPPVGCPAWRSLYRGGGGEMFAEPASVRRDGDRFEVRVRVLFDEPGDGGARTLVGTYRYDCRAQTSAMLHFSAYDGGGRRLADADATGPDAQPQTAEAGTPNAAVLDAFCPR